MTYLNSFSLIEWLTSGIPYWGVWYGDPLVLLQKIFFIWWPPDNMWPPDSDVVATTSLSGGHHILSGGHQIKIFSAVVPAGLRIYTSYFRQLN